MVRNASEAILKYLEEQNRPYSVVDILNNLHKEFGKTQIQKSLDQLSDNGKIREKVNGKQKIYSVIQSDIKGEDMKKELQNLEAQCGEITIKLGQVEQNLRKFENKLKELNAVPTTKEAEAELADLEEKIQLSKKKLAELSNNTVKISPAEKAKVVKNNDTYLKEARKRKRICMDIVNSIQEGYPKDKKTLYEEIGLETD